MIIVASPKLHLEGKDVHVHYSAFIKNITKRLLFNVNIFAIILSFDFLDHPCYFIKILFKYFFIIKF